MEQHIQRHLVINRYNPKDREFSLPNLEKILNVPQLQTIANDHQAVSGAINKGKPLRIDSPRSKPLADIDDLIDLMFSGPARTVHVNGASVFSRFRRAIGLK